MRASECTVLGERERVHLGFRVGRLSLVVSRVVSLDWVPRSSADRRSLKAARVVRLEVMMGE